MEAIEGATLLIPPSRQGQLPIIFGRTQPRELTAADSSSDSDTPQFFHYARSARHIMKKMGYDLKHGAGLNFGKGRRSLMRNFVPKGKPANYYDSTRRGLGYVTPTSSTTVQVKDDGPIPSHSASSSEWDSDVSVGGMFENLTVNMASSSQLEPAEAADEEPWAQQLNLQWEKRFELREPPIEDKVMQVNLGNQDHPKPIFISESLSLIEKEELIMLIK